MGSKSRIADYIAYYINKIAEYENIENYYEPFCGGCSVAYKVNIKNKYCSDKNKFLIALLKKVQEGMWEYKFIEKEERDDVLKHKYDGKYPDWYVGWVGFACGYRGRFFMGYVGKDNQYLLYKQLTEERQHLLKINLFVSDYRDVEIKDGSIVYCDAPYRDVLGDYHGGSIDYDEYYEYLKKISKKNLVFISEYRMPAGFIEIDSWNISVPVGNGCRKTHEGFATERLFVVEGGYLVDKYFNQSKDLLALL